jgi:hypothetical protein
MAAAKTDSPNLTKEANGSRIYVISGLSEHDPPYYKAYRTDADAEKALTQLRASEVKRDVFPCDLVRHISVVWLCSPLLEGENVAIVYYEGRATLDSKGNRDSRRAFWPVGTLCTKSIDPIPRQQSDQVVDGNPHDFIYQAHAVAIEP